MFINLVICNTSEIVFVTKDIRRGYSIGSSVNRWRRPLALSATVLVYMGNDIPLAFFVFASFYTLDIYFICLFVRLFVLRGSTHVVKVYYESRPMCRLLIINFPSLRKKVNYSLYIPSNKCIYIKIMAYRIFN